MNKDVTIKLLDSHGHSSAVLEGKVHGLGEGLLKLRQRDKIVWIPIHRIDTVTEVTVQA
jgi:hypothetical protein